MAKTKILRIELIEEIDGRGNVVQENRLDGCVVDFAGNGDTARDCYESVVNHLVDNGHALLEIDDDDEGDQDDNEND